MSEWSRSVVVVVEVGEWCTLGHVCWVYIHTLYTMVVRLCKGMMYVCMAWHGMASRYSDMPYRDSGMAARCSN